MKVFSAKGIARVVGGGALVLAVVSAASPPVGGIELYTPLPVHRCLRPMKPFEFTSQREIDQYRKDVEAYQNCIKRFVEEQNEAIMRHQQAIKLHQEAAKAAIDEWKDFVKGEGR